MRDTGDIPIASLSDRLPEKKQTIQFFLMCIFASHVWTILNFLHEIPALTLRLTALELVSVFSYFLTFALIEALVIWVIINLLSVILPPKILRDKFLAKASAILLMTYLWMIPLLRNFKTLLYWPRGRTLWFVLYLLLFFLIQYAFMKMPNLDRRITLIIEHLIVLSSVYVIFDFMAIIVILIRNIT
jgi:hypothetical protein